MKYSLMRFDIAPKRGEYQQTQRYVFPVLALWADGERYNQVGFMFGFWCWTIHVFFTTQS